MIKVEVVGVRVDQMANTPAMRLKECVSPHRYFDIFIGAPEAASIHTALEGTEMPRPLTHDLFVLALHKIEVVLKQVVITEMVSGTYYAEMTLTSQGVDNVISCRPSDGVALALRAQCPIYIQDSLIDDVGKVSPEADEEDILEEFKDLIDTIKPEDFLA